MFVYQSLLWIGLPLVALPVLIHLIHMMRHRRVKWAAMEFLLASQRRHRNWIIFKQLLLLLVRMAAVAAIAMMLAQPVLRNQWAGFFGGAKTHHIVLLDDSYSMSDRWADTNAFEQAKQVVQHLADTASRHGSSQRFSLLRFSKSSALATESQPDLFQENVGADFGVRLERILGPMRPSQTAAGPTEALNATRRQLEEAVDETRIVYLVSDFRSGQWSDVTELRELLQTMEESGTKLQLVHCVDTKRENLAIVSLEPKPGARAAGVELLMQVTVKNFGDAAANRVTVSLEEDGFVRGAVVIDEIEPGDAVMREFRANFPTAGSHSITANLESDAVVVDNSRFYAVDIPNSLPVLLIDGSRNKRDAYFLSSALAPGGKTNTGWKPQTEPTSFLRGQERLDRFAAIYLLNIGRLDGAQITKLEEYVRSGGGLAFFLGELSRADFFNTQLYRDGEGLFPVPITRPTDLLVDRLERAPDLSVDNHPAFAILAGERNSFVNMVVVERYFGVVDDWLPDPESSTRVIARLRNRSPFIVEKQFGAGRVVAHLSKVSPEATSLGSWNNWGRNNPSFPIAMNELTGYLASAGQVDQKRMIGQPLVVEMDAREHQSQVRFSTPTDEQAAVFVVDASTTPRGLTATLAETNRSGIYEAHLTDTEGSEERRLFSYNVATEEGHLDTLDRTQLASRLSDIDYEFHRAEDLRYDPLDLAGFNLSDTLLYLLIAVLVMEQMLAFSASYHLPSVGGQRK